MSFTDTIVIQLVANGSTTTTEELSVTADALIEFNKAVATGVTNAEIDLAIDVSAVKFAWIVSDQDVNLLTNSSGAPDDSFLLTANYPLFYVNGGPYDPLFTVDVTKILVTNASGSEANINIRVLYDSTPVLSG